MEFYKKKKKKNSTTEHQIEIRIHVPNKKPRTYGETLNK